MHIECCTSLDNALDRPTQSNDRGGWCSPVYDSPPPAFVPSITIEGTSRIAIVSRATELAPAGMPHVLGTRELQLPPSIVLLCSK